MVEGLSGDEVGEVVNMEDIDGLVSHILGVSKNLELVYAGSEEDFISDIKSAELRDSKEQESLRKGPIESSRRKIRELQKLRMDINFGNDLDKRIQVKELVKKIKPDLICLQETKMESVNRGDLRGLGIRTEWEFSFVGSNGASGGILIAWNENVWKKQEEWIGRYSLLIALKKEADNSMWLFSGVYGPVFLVEKALFWEELEKVRDACSLPWCIGGDFNEIMKVGERLGCFELIDLPLAGASFTWSRGPSWSRLDRFLMCSGWLNLVSDSSQKVLVHSVSDHCPLLLDPHLESWGSPPFRFELAWLSFPQMEDRLGSWWFSCSFEGPADVVIGKKLRITKLIALEECGLSSEEDWQELGNVKQEHKGLLLQEEISWRQKSRVKWLVEGDKNTAYFHAMASARRRSNRIESISVNGALISSKEEVSSAIVDFYSALYASEGVIHSIPEEVEFKSLNLEVSSNLEEPFAEEEVERGLFSMPKDKAPGPDSFCLAFFQVCWPVVKCDILRFFRDLYEELTLDRGTGATFITLIPKIKGATKVTDFRPISLVGCLYKLLAKVLVDRIKVVLPHIISDSQSAFVSKRQILDCSLITNEVIESYSKSEAGGVLCMLDMEKAYDRVDWDCLDFLLGRMGFGNRWRGWMRKLMSKGCCLGLLEGFVIGCDRVEVSLLQFADDTILFCAPDRKMILNLKATLRCYEFVTGQRSNFRKSSLFAINLPPSEAEEFAKVMGCRLNSLPSLYLGLPLGVGKPGKALWTPIVERIESRLETWKRNLVSKGGRLILVKAVLANIPVYYLSLFNCPVSVVLRIEQIQRRFLWGGADSKGGIPLVKWENVCMPIKNGGLGIRKLREFNRALLGKWLWRFGMEQSSLWVKVIGSKYGFLNGNWCSDDSYSKKCGNVWRNILRFKQRFEEGIQFKVYKGNRIKFWVDAWCSEEPLKTLFPDLFSATLKKEVLVCDCFERMDTQALLSQLMFGNSLGLHQFPFLVGQSAEGGFRPLNFLEEWECGWLQGRFGVSFWIGLVFAGFGRVQQCIVGKVALAFWYGTIFFVGKGSPLAADVWKFLGPPSVSFFGWAVCWGRIQTIEFLRRRGMWLVDYCSLCMEDGESIDHLFIHCKVAREIWGLILDRTSVKLGFCALEEEREIALEAVFDSFAVGDLERKKFASFKGEAKSTYWLFMKIIALVIFWAKCLPQFQFVSAFDLWEGWRIVCWEGVRREKIVQRWEAPPEGYLKINFDGSSLGNPGQAGIGALARNSARVVSWAFAGPIGRSDSSEAEVKAAFQGIHRLSRDTFGKVIVEGDSSNVISWLFGKIASP
ncbi:uncharacterized protein LOC143850444 [Tasmannia lanceolata]|uniref:uncharacterized protein LOC143850444 n=1 Tax=Tasmannia lanceolata TaxID=3420 RepID=UPI00406414E8